MHHPTSSGPRLTDSKEGDTAAMALVRILMLIASACAALLVVIPAEAAGGASAVPASNASETGPASASDSKAAAHDRYQLERATCMNGKSNQDRATCLKEAGAAYAQAQHGGLQVSGSSGGKEARAANATARCVGLPADESKACIARMQGAGTVSGTAASGGILRELVTVTPAASAVK